MQKIILSVFIISLGACSSSVSQTKTVSKESVYTAGLYFGSICCGTVSDDFVKPFVVDFNKSHETAIAADKAAGCGKEGEFMILFRSSKTGQINDQFEKALMILVEKTNAENKVSNSSSGYINLVKDVQTTSLGHCRLGITELF